MTYTAINRIGMRYGRLVVTERAENRNEKSRWVCQCDCGNTKTVIAQELESGKTRSCGCFRKEVAAASLRTHGLSHINGKTMPEYQAWSGLIQRCENPKNKRFHDYGGRGIKVCERWRISFADFFADMGLKPSPKHSIDRINNDGNYESGNCRWATDAEQRSNKRSIRPRTTRHNGIYVALDGKRLLLKIACEKIGVNYDRVRRRFYKNGRTDIYAALGLSHG